MKLKESEESCPHSTYFYRGTEGQKNGWTEGWKDGEAKTKSICFFERWGGGQLKRVKPIDKCDGQLYPLRFMEGI